MNIILLSAAQIEASEIDAYGQNSLLLNERQATHCIRTLHVQPGDTLLIGIVNKKIGHAQVSAIKENQVWLSFDPSSIELPPPAASPVVVYLALPRPKMLRRMLRTIAEVGVKSLYIINTSKVEKSYWQSPSLEAKAIEQYFSEGLEQSKDTVMPEYRLEKLFRPFVEDRLSKSLIGQNAWVAHAADSQKSLTDLKRSIKEQPTDPLHLFIGPEGGFNTFEVEALTHAGAQSFNAGPRVFRTETFLPWIFGAMQ